jgi:hypothetical protein
MLLEIAIPRKTSQKKLEKRATLHTRRSIPEARHESAKANLKEEKTRLAVSDLETTAKIVEELKQGNAEVEIPKRLERQLKQAQEKEEVTKPLSKFDFIKKQNEADGYSLDDIAFIPDYDPNQTIKQNLENVSKNPGMQSRFLSCTAHEVLLAGGRGSSKSSALIADPLRFCDNKNFRALIIRKAMPDLRDLITRCQILYRQAFPGVKYKANEKMFTFPSGARIEFGYCETIDDLERYRGQEYTWVGVDEVAQYPGSWVIERLKASMRSSDPTLPIYLRCSCNPLGPGRQWVMDRWKIEQKLDSEGNVLYSNAEEIQEETFKTPIGDMSISRTWFYGTVRDNKVLMHSNPHYIASLASHSNKAVRAQELYGSWDSAEGLAFPEFRKDVHVVDNFTIPPNWYRWRACDYGYSSMGVNLWFATDWDNNVYVYRELATSGVLVDDFAQRIKDAEFNETISIGFLDGSLWSKRGEIGETPADTMSRMGVHWTPADRSPNSRKTSKLTVHKYLARDTITGQPKLKILACCKELIKELATLQLDPNDPEDIDRSKKTSLPDHAYDALRYGLQSMPDTAVRVPDPFLEQFVETDRYIPIDAKIGI